MPEMTPVSSSHLAAVGYDAEARELTIEFTDGNTYTYAGIEAQLYEDLMSASSPGSFFWRYIRQRPFTWE